MSTETHLFTSFFARDFQPWIGFGSAFARPGFQAPGAIAGARLRNESEQGSEVGVAIHATRRPPDPQLYGVFETQFPRVNVGTHGRLRHEQTDQVIREQMNPQLFVHHLRGVAAQDVNAERLARFR